MQCSPSLALQGTKVEVAKGDYSAPKFGDKCSLKPYDLFNFTSRSIWKSKTSQKKKKKSQRPEVAVKFVGNVFLNQRLRNVS